MIEIDKDTKLSPLKYILNNDVEINIKFNESINIDINRKETFDNQLDTIINYLNYYGIAYDIGLSIIDTNYINDMLLGIAFNDMLLGISFTTHTLNITKDDLEILDKDQMINLLNSILDIVKNNDVMQLEINTYDLGYNPYQE